MLAGILAENQYRIGIVKDPVRKLRGEQNRINFCTRLRNGAESCKGLHFQLSPGDPDPNV